MKAMKLIACTTYFLSWCICLLPNASIHGQSYDEPQNDQIVSKMIDPVAVEDHDTTCDGYVHDVALQLDIEDLLRHEGTNKSLDEDANTPYDPDDYDSGDYDDY